MTPQDGLRLNHLGHTEQARPELGYPSRLRGLNRSTASIPNARRITNIVRKDAMTLPQDANLSRMEFSERTADLFCK
jgi:hypothetical protein